MAVLAGCAGTHTDLPTRPLPPPSSSTSDGGSPDPSPSGSPSGSPSDGLPPARNGSDLSACYNARCEVRLADGDTIGFAPRFAVGTMRFAIGADGMTATAGYPDAGGGMQSSVGRGGEMVMNGIRIQVEAIAGSAAVVEISPSST
ncbi:hypothetical protein BIV57_04490 [Mangrovactinospora gilvigrisea]|uniref:Uncharacterized protein n=1 Tax=Mangrovactinospora gilvigrisea TaxID=1428644 RepID=A0A1J7BJ39_9ACTN|nr:hypothetical protein BIV57_04490 [Mangrovactinospora gilvigrisea]